MSSVITIASPALPSVPRSVPAAPTPVVSDAGGARAEALPARTTHQGGVESQRGRSVVPRIEERERESRDTCADSLGDE
eukprot:11759172-Alexandrium_andersonii.AAC.1